MIKHLTHDMIDKKRWDDCIAKSFNGSVYAWSWYLDIVHPKWEALIENDYERVMPLTGKTKLGISYLFQPFFVQQLGIFSQSLLSQNDVESFIHAINSKYKVVKYRLNEYNKVCDEWQFVEKHRNVELDLIHDYQYLYSNYSKNTKRNLAKAESAGLTLNRNVVAADVVQLFRNNRGHEVKHWNDREYARLLDLIETAVYHECCFLIGANNIDGQLIAGAVFMCSHDRIIFLFSGNDDNYKDKHALTFLLDSTIREFSETQYIFDFEGSDNEGLARFYKGFGGKEVFYPEIRLNNFKGIFKFACRIMGKG